METVTDFIFLGSKITVDGDSSHDIKRCLLLGRKTRAKLDTMLKSKDTTLPPKVHIVKAMVFPVVMYRCERWIIKNAECQRTDAFEQWGWRRLLRVPWTARRSTLNIHWKDWCKRWSSNTLATWCEEQTHWQRPWCWERLKAAEDGMVGWHHGFNGHEFEQTPEESGGQRSLVCCSPWGCKGLDTT